MFNAVKKTIPVDVAVCAAAVSDFKPVNKSKNKLKKKQNHFRSIEIEENKDIVEYITSFNKTLNSAVYGHQNAKSQIERII